MLSNFFYLSLNSIRYRQVRSWLTIIGIVIGIAVVIAVLFLGAGMKDAVAFQLQKFGSGIIVALPGKISDMTGFLSKNRFKDADVEAIKRAGGVDVAMPIIEQPSVRVEFMGEKKSTILHGQPWESIKKIYEQSQGLSMGAGEWPTNDDAREIVVGKKLATKVFKREIQVGDMMTVKSREFKVVGILNETGEQNHDGAVFISVKMFRTVVGESLGYRTIVIKAESGYDGDLAAENVRYELSKQKNIGDFTVMTSGKAMRLVGNIIAIIEFILAAIAAVAVVVGSVSIMNTMYTSVLEQTKEIGVMKAIGARNSHIILIFLIESGIIGLVGGAFGIILGMILAKAVEYYAHNNGFPMLLVTFSPWTIIIVAVGAFFIGIASGFFPARSATKLKPTEALRYE
ncbi:MAG: ABC transporter permease [Candidatus Buchananbacteria bacterium]